MYLALLFLFGCALLLRVYEKKIIVHHAPSSQAVTNAFYRRYKTPAPPIDEGPLPPYYYIVQEQWEYKQTELVDYNYSPHPKMFRKGTQEECKANAERYFAERLKAIALQKLMVHEVEKVPFTLTLVFAYEAGGSAMGHVIQTVNESNLPLHEDFKQGLYRMNNKPYPQHMFS